MNLVPFIPENSPFSPEQRAWLNGFFAGIYSRTQPENAPSAPSPKALSPLTILYGSQTGTAEILARKAASEAGKRGFAPSVIDMGEYSGEQLKNEKTLLILTSTYGDGEPPDNAKGFWEYLGKDKVPRLDQLQYSILALGDTNYAKFCECGKFFDRRLEELGAKRAFPRIDCDVDYDEPFRKWLNGVLPALNSSNASSVVQPPTESSTTATEPPKAWSKRNPFPASLLTNRKLNGPGSDKDTRHFEISLVNSGLGYEAGDALGVMPTNCPTLVGELLKTLGYDGEEPVSTPENQTIALRKALLSLFEVSKVSNTFIEAIARKTGDATLQKLLAPESKEALRSFLLGREIIDLLLSFPKARFEPSEFVGLLKKLAPRLYSISSSPKAHPDQVHLTVATVRYTSHGRHRKGVCSTFLADRVGVETPVPIFVHPNKNFRPPTDSDCPMIMVGPGTGIAPFRAFLEERQVTGAKGKNWLFFGDQHEKVDFLYQDELKAMQKHGVLNRLDTAFSRDQTQKIYVQHRMLEHARNLFAWLEEGASFYICGDANRMAKDVHQALHQVIEQAGGRTAEEAMAYVKKLQTDKRYQRDVY